MVVGGGGGGGGLKHLPKLLLPTSQKRSTHLPFFDDFDFPQFWKFLFHLNFVLSQ